METIIIAAFGAVMALLVASEPNPDPVLLTDDNINEFLDSLQD